MSTLNKLSHQVIRILSAGPQPRDSKLDKNYIAEELRQVIHGLIKADYYQAKNDSPSSFMSGDSTINHLCIATYRDQPVLNDAQRNRNYAVLPVPPMNLRDHRGIQWVYVQYDDQPDEAAIPIQPGELELFRGINAGLEITNELWCYEPDRNRIWFTERNSKTLLDEGVENVEIKLVVIDPSQVGMDDALPIPPEYEMEAIKQVLQLHGYNGAPVADLLNDGNPNTR